MAGQGPDIVFWYNYMQTEELYGSEFNDIYKVMEAGVFYNIDNFIANDPDFHMADYNETVLNMGIYKGQRQFMPLSYGASYYITSKEALAKNKIILPDNPTYDDFYNQITSYCQTNEESAENWLLNNPGIERGISYLYPFNGLEVLDYEQENVNVNTEEFQKMVETYQGMGGMLTKPDRGITYPYPFNSASAEAAIVDGHMAFKDAYTYGTLFYVSEGYGVLSALGQTPIIMGIPNINGGKTTAFSRQNAAINKAGENKANAYEFMKIMLSMTMQSSVTYETYSTDIPVHNDARVYKIEIMTQEDKWFTGDKALISPAASPEQREEIYHFLTNVEPIKNYAVAQEDILEKYAALF